MGQADQQHLDWLARSTGRADYRPLGSSDVEAIAGAAEVVVLQPGSFLFREGDEPVAVYFVEQGEVEIYRGEGAKRRILARLGAGGVLGDRALFGVSPYVATAHVLRPGRAYRFGRDPLLRALAAKPDVLLRWVRAVTDRLEQTQRRVITLMHKSVLAQVADLLAEEAERQPDVNLTQSAMAMLLGVSRQSVNEALGRLREQGIVETGYRHIMVMDSSRLTEIAQG